MYIYRATRWILKIIGLKYLSYSTFSHLKPILFNKICQPLLIVNFTFKAPTLVRLSKLRIAIRRLKLTHSLPSLNFMKSFTLPLIYWVLFCTKTLLFLGKSTFIIIHNHLQAENQRRVYSSLAIGRQKGSISFFVFAYVLVEKQIMNQPDG